MPNRITLKEFNALPEQEQLNIIFTIGEVIEIKMGAPNIKNVLYSVDRFFVEYHSNPEDPETRKIYAFEAGEYLDKYSNDFQGIL